MTFNLLVFEDEAPIVGKLYVLWINKPVRLARSFYFLFFGSILRKTEGDLLQRLRLQKQNGAWSSRQQLNYQKQSKRHFYICMEKQK